MFVHDVRRAFGRTGMAMACALAAVAMVLAGPSAAKASGDSTAMACGTWVKAYAPYRTSGKARVNGTYNNCYGRMTKVCLSLNFFHVVPPVGGEWVPAGNKCTSASKSPYDTTFGVTEPGPTKGYGNYVGHMVGYDSAGRVVASHTGPVAAV